MEATTIVDIPSGETTGIIPRYRKYQKRGTISVPKSQLQASEEEIKRWHGMPPRPLREKTWRAEEFRF